MSQFVAGQKIRASDLNRACPILFEQEATSDYTLTTSYADIPGATITFTTSVPNAVVEIDADFDLRTTAAPIGYCYGAVDIDGTRHARQCLQTYTTTETRSQGHLRIKTSVATAGSHTIKLSAKKDGAGGTAIFAATTTVLSLTVFGI